MSDKKTVPRQLKIWEAYIVPVVLIIVHLTLIQLTQLGLMYFFGEDKANQTAIFGVMLLNIILIPVYGFYLNNRKKRASESLWREPATGMHFFRTVAWSFVGVILTIFVAASLVALLQILPGTEGILERYSMLQETLAGVDVPLWASLLSITMFAPITEELLLRGIVLGAFKDRLKPWVANLITAVLFGVMHLNLIQGVYAIVLGLILGYIYIRTKNLVYPILLHILLNLLGAGFAQIFDLLNKPESAVIYMLALIVLALVSGGFLIWLAVKEGEEKRRQKA